MVAVALTACSPETFDEPNQNGLPAVSGVDFQLSVDQETNQMVAHYTPAPGTYPIWILNGTQYSTLHEVGYQNPEAGDYQVELKLGNRNGFSQGSVSKTFTFNETKIDYSAEFRKITGKEWRFANKEVAHIACGPAGTAGTGWWSAAPDEKKGFGLYDDRITFTAENRKGGTFTYNPGADGMTYLNKGVTLWATQNDAADVDAVVGAQTASWTFEVYDWEDADKKTTKQTYIQLAPNTAFPYISVDAQYQDPKFRVEQLTAKKLVLVYEAPDRSIAWRYVFTSEAEETKFSGYDANSSFNMWKGITPTMTFHYQPGWADIKTDAFAALFKGGDNDYQVTVPDACGDRWQAQVHFHTDLNLSAANHYDFSAVFNTDRDISGVTVKLTEETDQQILFDVADVSLKAGEDYVFLRSDFPGIDLSKVKLVLDFGRAAGPTNINVSNIVLKNHADNDGTVLPEETPQPNGNTIQADWDVEAAANLWKTVESGNDFVGYDTFFADNGWITLPTQPEIKHVDGTWELTIPGGMGSSQWQGQLKIFTSLKASQSKKYKFCCVLESDTDIAGATIKLTQSDVSAAEKHDNNFFFDGRHDLKADEPFVYKAEGAVLPIGDAHALTLVCDFGGAPEGAHVKISKIYLEETE